MVSRGSNELRNNLCERQLDDAALLKVPAALSLQYESYEDVLEALENFRAYVAILREWDQKQRANETLDV